jgi:hypothetical protein
MAEQITPGPADYLVELRGFDPLTSGADALAHAGRRSASGSAENMAEVAPSRRLLPKPSSGEGGEGSLRCERINIAILDIKLSSRIAYARERAAVRRRIVRRGHATVEKSCLPLVLRPSAGTAQAEAAKMSLPTGRMLQSGMFGSNVHAARVDFRLRLPPLILGYEGLGYIRLASPLGADGDVLDAPQRAVERTGMESVDDPLADEEALQCHRPPVPIFPWAEHGLPSRNGLRSTAPRRRS